MKKASTSFTLLLIVICVLSACALPYAQPESGRFYCEDLEMTLDFSTYKATFVESGTEITKSFNMDYGAQLSIPTIDQNGYYDVIFIGDFKYRSGKVTIKTDDGKKYTFLPVEDGATEQEDGTNEP